MSRNCKTRRVTTSLTRRRILLATVGRGRRFPWAASLAALLGAFTACSSGGYNPGKPDGSSKPRPNPQQDLSTEDPDPPDLRTPSPSDLATSSDLATLADLATPPADFASSPPDMAGPTGPITGGPCMGSTMGATAFRVSWYKSGSTAAVRYDVHGLPDKSRSRVIVAGYTIPFTPQWTDPFLGPGGLQLDSSSFIDLELSTAGLSRISNVTISIFGRSVSTGSSGSFSWQTRDGIGATPTNSVSNVTPYRWYPGDATPEIRAGDAGMLIRIKAGGSSNSLAVNQLEVCMVAS